MTRDEIQSIIDDNNRKKAELFAEYNPLTGIGSPVERIALNINATSSVLIPKTMVKKEALIADVIYYGDVMRYAKAKNIRPSVVTKAVTRLRLKWDFEFWAATCAKIMDKQESVLVPFLLRRPQRKLLKELLNAVYKENAIRIILLKARQWGGSTLVQLFMAWIQLEHKKSWNSAIVGKDENQARNIRRMYSLLANYYPKSVRQVKLRPFEGSTKNKIVDGRDCVIYIGSVQNPDSIRSSDIKMAHLSEVGLWQATTTRKPEDLVQTLAGTIPSNVPYSMMVIESTAKGLGNFFHDAWIKAESGQSGYTPVFVAWFEIEMYYAEFLSDATMIEFIESMTDKERYHFSLGATLEGVQWYRYKQYSDGLDDWNMACEFPSTPQEAFQSTGNRAHPPQYVEQMRKYAKQPQYIGDMFADTQYGPEAIGKSLVFKEAHGGKLHLWELPDKTVTVSNRYVVSVDIGGKTDKADFSVISVIDRYFLSEEGVEECIGTWTGHLDQDLVIWKAVQIAKYYNNALLVVESNSLNPKGEEGDHTLTILDEIKDYYDNLFCRTDPQRIKEGLPKKWGFHTNKASKTDLVTQMNRRFRENGYIERDQRALDEADWYEIKPDGSYGAVSGKHDDIYMSRAIGLKVSSMMDLPKLIEHKKTVRTTGFIRTESSF